MSTKVKIPMRLLLPHFVGMFLAGLGLAEVFAKTNFVPAQFQFENYGWFMIVIGYLLSAPVAIFLISAIRANMKK